MRVDLIVAACLAATPLWATDFTALSQAERTLLGQEIRQALRDDPTPVIRAFNPPVSDYSDAIDRDRQVLAELAPQLWAHPQITTPGAPQLVIFSTPDCAECADIRPLLNAWAKAGRMSLYELPLDSAPARALGLDTAPSYVLDHIILRGDIPAPVLEKYLQKQGG